MNRDDFHIEKRKFIDGIPKKTSNILNSERIYGNNVKNSHQSKYVFDGDELDSVDYSAFVDYVKDAMDINYGYGNTQLQYESLGTGENSYGIVFSINVWPDISHLLYCDTCT